MSNSKTYANNAGRKQKKDDSGQLESKKDDVVLEIYSDPLDAAGEAEHAGEEREKNENNGQCQDKKAHGRSFFMDFWVFLHSVPYMFCQKYRNFTMNKINFLGYAILFYVAFLLLLIFGSLVFLVEIYKRHSDKGIIRTFCKGVLLFTPIAASIAFFLPCLVSFCLVLAGILIWIDIALDLHE